MCWVYGLQKLKYENLKADESVRKTNEHSYIPQTCRRLAHYGGGR